MPLKRLMNWLYPEEDEADLEMQDDLAPSPTPAAEAPLKRSSRGTLVLRNSADGGMEIRHPRNLDDRMAVGMDLKHRRMVTLDLTRLPDSEARYFLEFIYGVVFALDATAEKVTDGIYLLAPHGVSVNNDTEIEGDPAPAPPAGRTTTRTSARDRQEELFWQGG